jgi:hypothetical protein
MFTVIWLIIFSVGLPVVILILVGVDLVLQTLVISLILYNISSYTNSIVALVWISVIKRRMFLKIIGNISEVDKKIQYTPQEETYMNRNVLFNIISEIILLTVFQCILITLNTYNIASESYYIIVIETITSVSGICNTLLLFQFVNLVFMMKQRYSHLNKRLTNWINEAVSMPIYLNKEDGRHSQSDRVGDHIIVTTVCVSSVGNIEGTLSLTDIHLLRQIHSELYDITCSINNTYGIPILATMCWILTGVLSSLYEELVYFKVVGLMDILFLTMYSVLFYKLIFVCHRATNEARSSNILVQKFL